MSYDLQGPSGASFTDQCLSIRLPSLLTYIVDSSASTYTYIIVLNMQSMHMHNIYVMGLHACWYADFRTSTLTFYSFKYLWRARYLGSICMVEKTHTNVTGCKMLSMLWGWPAPGDFRSPNSQHTWGQVRPAEVFRGSEMVLVPELSVVCYGRPLFLWGSSGTGSRSIQAPIGAQAFQAGPALHLWPRPGSLQYFEGIQYTVPLSLFFDEAYFDFQMTEIKLFSC